MGVNGANSNIVNTAFGVRLQASQSGTVTTILVNSADTPGINSHGALYADNAGQLTGATRLSGDLISPSTSSGWHVYTVSPGVAVTSGTFYWLEFLDTDSAYNYTDFATSGGTTRDTTAQTTLPNPAATTTANFTNSFNAYADGIASGGIVQTFNPLPFMR